MEEARQLILGAIKIINWTGLGPDTRFSTCDLRFGIEKRRMGKLACGLPRACFDKIAGVEE